MQLLPTSSGKVNTCNHPSFKKEQEKNDDISRGLLADKFYVESFASQFFLAEWKFSSISNAIERIEGKPKATQTDEPGNYSFFCSERWKLVAVENSRPEEKVFFSTKNETQFG